MSAHQAPHPRTGFAPLIAAAAITILAIVLVPPIVADAFAGGSGLATANLPSTVESGFDAWVADGGAHPPATLAAASRMWAAFHVAKAALAVVLGFLALGLVRRCAHRWAHAGRTRARLLAGLLTAASTAVLAVAAVVALANIQGAVAPLSSLVSMLPAVPTPAMRIAGTLVGNQPGDPFAATLIADFRTYHLALAWAAAGALVAIAVNGIRLMRAGRAGGSESAPARRIRITGVVASWSAVAVLGLLVAANASTAAQPGPALVAFLTGSA